MVLQRIRHSKSKMRLPLIIMVAVLAVGMVGSFAIWSSPQMALPTNQNAPTAQEQIASLQKAIDNQTESLENDPKNFGILTTLAGLQAEQANYYDQAGNGAKAGEVYQESIDNYLVALDNAPDGLNAQGQADIMVKAAACAMYAGQNSTAEALYQSAMQLLPEDYSIKYQYVLYLALGKKDIAEAQKVLAEYQAVLQPDDPNFDAINQLAQGLAALQQDNADQTDADASGEKTE